MKVWTTPSDIFIGTLVKKVTPSKPLLCAKSINGEGEFKGY